MTCIRTLALCLALLITGFLHAGPPPGTLGSSGWPALDQAIWAIKSEDLPDRPGALVLLDRFHFQKRGTERFRRILVLSEPGRTYADIQLNASNVTKLEGRTVLPDGMEAPFIQGKDVVKSETILGKQGKEVALKVFPPGVTTHCIVDVRWFEPNEEFRDRPIPGDSGYSLLISLSEAVPVKRAELTFDPDISDTGWMKKIEVDPGQKHSLDQKNGLATYVFEDIAARKVVPLASRADVLRPIFNWFYAPQVRDWLTYLGFPADKPVNVLEGSAKTFLYEWYAVPLENDRVLKLELQNMAKATEGMEPHARARALVRVLRRQVRTLGELQDLPDRRGSKTDLLRVLRRGWGTSEQLNHLGFLLLREGGLEVALVSAIDREENKLMDPSNIFQYDQTYLGVKDAKGQWSYLNPGSTFEPFGVSPWLQGGRALMVIPAAKRLEWGATFTSIPLAESASNTQVWSATVTPGEESDVFSVGFEATGSMAARWKQKLHDQQAPELKKGLGLILERGRFQLQKAEGEGALDPWSGFKVTFDGNLEHDGGRRRVVSPFPFLQPPFAIPATWPEQRTVGIQLPMACRIQAETRMLWPGGELPGGGLEPLERENVFGKVSWTATLEDVQGAKTLVARLRIEVQRPLGSPMYYDQLKAFSGWIQEALNRGLPVPRS